MICVRLPCRAATVSGLIAGTWRKRGRADNWFVALYSDGIWLNLRDCEYYGGGAGPNRRLLP